MKKIKRGDVYLVKLNPTVGKEINKTRPALIIQANTYNQYGQTTIVAPITSNINNLGPSKVLIIPPEGGLKNESAVLLKQIRTVDNARLVKKLGSVQANTIKQVNQALIVCLDLF